MSRADRSAVIAGAGIGGVTAAAALAQRGWSVTVVERSPRLGEVGAGIAIWPGALAVLEQLGVTDALRGATLSAGRGAFSLPDGTAWEIPHRRGATPVMVHRARLHDAIRASFGDGGSAAGRVQVRLGASAVDARTENDQAVLITAGGDEVRADLLIGADGLRSTVRTAIGGPAEVDRIRYAGYTAFRGISPETTLDPDDHTATIGGEVFGRGLRFGYVPLVDHRTYWYATVTASEGSSDPQLLHEFDAWHDPVPELISSTAPDAVLHNDMYDLTVPLPQFTAGRIALLGDAAHAMTPNLGQGACSAIQDAALLARLLDQADVTAALHSYDRIRRPAAERMVRLSRLVGDLGHTRHPAILVPRNTLLRAAGGLARVRRRMPITRWQSGDHA